MGSSYVSPMAAMFVRWCVTWKCEKSQLPLDGNSALVVLHMSDVSASAETSHRAVEKIGNRMTARCRLLALCGHASPSGGCLLSRAERTYGAVRWQGQRPFSPVLATDCGRYSRAPKLTLTQ